MIRLKTAPVDTPVITSKYGTRDLVVAGTSYWWHNGVDLKATQGTPVRAAQDGTVMVAKDNPGGYGLYVVLDHSTFGTLYAHLSSITAQRGTKVKAGDLIGYSGNTGASTGPHLHFEVREGVYNTFWDRCQADRNVFMRCVDPEPYIDATLTQDRLTQAEAEQIIVKELGFDDNTMRYLTYYRYGKELIEKIAKALI